jgi:hypothetical protein
VADQVANPGPDLAALYAPFRGGLALPAVEPLGAEHVPEPYNKLLIHEHHMTVTVEAHHGKPVYLRVLGRHRAGPWYSRKILLLPVGTDLAYIPCDERPAVELLEIVAPE